MLKLYSALTSKSGPVLRALLRKRARKGKEDPARMDERMGEPGLERPAGPLIWFHAASVGEAQSTLILIDALKDRFPDIHVLVTSGTVTSATLMEKRLPSYALHQYYPLDHPQWVTRFLDHWKPQMVLWMESEIWPNMLASVKQRHIPAALVNARLSQKSFRRWKLAASEIRALLSTFGLFLAQTETDAGLFRQLGAEKVITGDNLKYGAAPLPVDDKVLSALQHEIGDRPIWLYASTHEGEEELACRLHTQLKRKFPELLTIIVPRHPERRDAIRTSCKKYGLNIRFRTSGHIPPHKDDDIYIADTLGELGIFYKLCPVACIGRSLSNDGGGGHNPIEAAQLGCAILHGPHIQNLAQIYEEMDKAGAALKVTDEKDFQLRLERLLSDSDGLGALQNKALTFVTQKAKVVDRFMDALSPLLTDAGLVKAGTTGKKAYAS